MLLALEGTNRFDDTPPSRSCCAKVVDLTLRHIHEEFGPDSFSRSDFRDSIGGSTFRDGGVVVGLTPLSQLIFAGFLVEEESGLRLSDRVLSDM